MYTCSRELLPHPVIEAVNIATGERWYSLSAMGAARWRKHIFCQKPLALTVEESKAIRDAVQRYGVSFQLGAQQRSSAIFRNAVELVRNGKIGQLQTIAIGSAGGGQSALPLGLGFTRMPAETP